MEPRISMITLGVSNLERAAAFYEGGLGFPRKPLEGEASVVFFSLKGTWLALYDVRALAEDADLKAPEEDLAGPFRGMSLAHNVPTREEVDTVLQQAVAAGGRLVKPAQDAEWGGYSGYFSDPDGHLWEVAWNPFFWIGPETGPLALNS